MIETKDLFAKSDLIPVIIQDRATKDILMLGYTNQEAYQKTLETHTAWFWSRSRQKLWNKGETSGHFLYVKKMITDCDTDTLLYLCDPVGPTCHTGRRSCFFTASGRKPRFRTPCKSSTRWWWIARYMTAAKSLTPTTCIGKGWIRF